MGERTKKIVSSIIICIAFVVFTAMVVLGQRNIGVKGIVVQLVGLAGLVSLLYLYNRKFT